jgi:ribosomal protein S18 acetylase RimI-like enzyme
MVDFGGEEELVYPVLDAHQWICIRKMKLEDIERVNKIDAKSMESRISMDWFLKIHASAPDLQHVACNSRVNPVDPAGVVGFVVGRPYDPANHDPLGYISRIAVIYNYRRHGIGTMLENAFESALLDRGVNTMRVHARVANFEAVRFYQGVGLQILGTIPGHYKKPPGDGFVMEKKLERGHQNFNSCFPK